MDISKIVQDIQYVLAPSVMISSSALLLLGLQTKFSNLASRFRGLNHEKRQLQQKPSRDASEQNRLKNLEEQVSRLMFRAGHVRTSIILTYAAIVFFTATSILIFLNVFVSFHIYRAVVAVFLLGFLCILVVAVLMIAETQLLYKVIALEERS